MQRSKQQALMFLLGALLVGGVVGFSAERVMRNANKDHSWAARTAMYDDLALSPAQREAMDSVIDEKNRRVDSLLKPVKPQLDSVRANARTRMEFLELIKLRGMAPAIRDAAPSSLACVADE